MTWLDLHPFHFGEMRALRRGNVGAYVLHVQCPWRLEHADRIYTGSEDLWEPSTDSVEDADWDYEKHNLQDERLTALLGGWDAQTRSAMNTSGLLVVETLTATDLGGVSLLLSGGYQLVVFPAGSAGESWRLLGHQVVDHFVVAGGRIEAS